MKQAIRALLLLLVTSTFKRMQTNPQGHIELTRLKLSLMYIRAIKTFRGLFLSLFGIGICLVFLMAGLILFHVSLFLYGPWSIEAKMMIGVLSSVVYLGVALFMFYQLFASEKWLKIFYADGIIRNLSKASDKEKVYPDQPMPDAPAVFQYAGRTRGINVRD